MISTGQKKDEYFLQISSIRNKGLFPLRLPSDITYCAEKKIFHTMHSRPAGILNKIDDPLVPYREISKFRKTASTIVLPVSLILLSSMPSFRRFCRSVSVGAKSRSEI